MPPQLLAWIALGCFFAAGAIGAALLFSHWRRLRVPLAGAFPHGFFAGAGLVFLLVAVVMSWGEEDGGIGVWPVVSLVLLLAAAGAGVALFYLHARAGAVPLWLGAAHGGTALLGVIILFLSMAGQSWTAEPVPLNPADLDTRINPTPAQRAVPAPSDAPLPIEPPPSPALLNPARHPAPPSPPAGG